MLTTDSQPREIPNTFQGLIDSPECALYTASVREAHALVIQEQYFASVVIPAFHEGARKHVEQRLRVLTAAEENVTCIERTVAALSDSHFRKQRSFGPSKESIRGKVENAYAQKRPLEFVALMFTRKNICPLKRVPGDESQADAAELLSLIHLNSFATYVAEVYPFGATITLLSEGMRFKDAFEVPEHRIREYQRTLQRWMQEQNLSHLTLVEYEDFVTERLQPEQRVIRNEQYEIAKKLYESLMVPLCTPDALNEALASACVCDPVYDPRNARNNFVPLWDSIKHSIPYPQIEEYAKAEGVEYESLYRRITSRLEVPRACSKDEQLRNYVITKSWHAAIEHNARIQGDVAAGVDVAALIGPSAFRLTINPKPHSPHLGIYSVRETTSRVQPWHGTAYLTCTTEGVVRATVLSRLEIESKGGVPVHIGSKNNPTFFYASPEVAEQLREEQHLSVSMNTRA